jgi:hypothetical protein
MMKIMEMDVIEPSDSPYSSPIVIVKKRMGGIGLALTLGPSTRSHYL